MERRVREESSGLGITPSAAMYDESYERANDADLLELQNLLSPFGIEVHFRRRPDSPAATLECAAARIATDTASVQVALPRQSGRQGALAWDHPIAAASLVVSQVLGVRPPFLAASEATFPLLREALAPGVASAPLLVEGEIGTGKKSLVRLIHAACGGTDFMNLDGAVLDLKVSMPFKLREAHEDTPLPIGSTIFLDRAAEIPPTQQIRLAELIKVQCSNQAREGKVAVHYVAAAKIAQPGAATRAALMPALRGVFETTLRLPPMRERREEIPLLADYFLRSLNSSQTLSPGAIAALCDYGFPGNVRELRNLVTRLAISGGQAGAAIRASDIRDHLGRPARANR